MRPSSGALSPTLTPPLQAKAPGLDAPHPARADAHDVQVPCMLTADGAFAEWSELVHGGGEAGVHAPTCAAAHHLRPADIAMTRGERVTK